MTQKIWMTKYTSLNDIHKKIKEEVEQEYLESQADILTELDGLLKNLHCQVLDGKSNSPEFYDMADHFLQRAMTISDPALTVRYVNLALTEWNLPFNPVNLPSFDRFHEIYGLYIEGKSDTKTDITNITSATNSDPKWLTLVVWSIIAGVCFVTFMKG